MIKYFGLFLFCACCVISGCSDSPELPTAPTDIAPAAPSFVPIQDLQIEYIGIEQVGLLESGDAIENIKIRLRSSFALVQIRPSFVLYHCP